MEANKRIPKEMHEKVENLEFNVGETFKDEEGFEWRFEVGMYSGTTEDLIVCEDLMVVEKVFI